eukprot:TRINITY_DN30067_c0_g1_i4.p1 TRINITY_DN30067_c0_g1~~TRINITY_DN30067_c0_g1_i4.p1  ORF type:complete len:620 (+),score=107.19 TRINITY_DN30067_c0_g1_i4:229-2088(+)
MVQHLMSLLDLPLHLNQLKQIHALIITKNCDATSFIKRLLNISAVNYACILFNKIPQPDQNLCNSMVSTFSRLSLHKESIEAFFLIQNKKTQMLHFAFPPVIKSCTSQDAVDEGKQVHSLAVSNGFCSNAFIQTSLIDFYWKTGDLDSAKRVFEEVSDKDPVSYNCLIAAYSRFGRVLEARQLFDEMPVRTTVSWNSMISCYAHNGDLREGLRMFERMSIERAWPNEFTLVTVLSICAKLGDLEMGLKVKKFVEDNRLCRNMIMSTAILEMYVKCGAIDDARREFDGMAERDVVAWSAMIAGYAQNGRSNEALELFEEMKRRKIKPNDVTLVSILSACGQLGSVEVGEMIGNYVESEGLSLNVYVGSALLDMYAKCGNIGKARQVFNEMPEKDVVSWNSMIAGLAVNGFEEEAINLYFQMNDSDAKPNDVTFVALLTACTHAGLVELGCRFFKSMRRDHNIKPQVEHCACVVDLFCRAGRLDEAYEFICKMEVEPNVIIWGSLLSACRINSNVALAERAVEKLLLLEPENSGNYVLLSNLYASVGRWEESLKTRALMKEKGVQKTAAYSWIEVDGMVHKFLVEDTSHPRLGEIYSVVDGLGLQLKLPCCSAYSVLELSS